MGCTPGTALSCTHAGGLEWIAGDHEVEWCAGGTWHDTTTGTVGNCTDKPGKIKFIGGTLQYCNDATPPMWMKMQGASIPGATCPAGTLDGKMVFDPGIGSNGQFKVCVGMQWYKVGP